MKERVVFEANVPVIATLAYSDGMKVQGRFGDQVMYSLADGRVMYVPPIVREKLVELGIRQNEPFAICRAERREGNRRFIDWVVQRNGTSPPYDVATPLANVQTGHTANNASSVQSASGNGNRVPDGNGKSTGPPVGTTAAQSALRSALMASIDAALAAEQYASAHGLSVRFGSEDLRAMALSLFIQHSRDGGIR
jgi:hypothetical protein